MILRDYIVAFLVFSTLVIPIVQLSFGFHYINSPELCPLQHDIMLLMAIGGVFQAISFAALFGCIYSIAPSKYKRKKKKTTAQASAKGSNRASQILIACITAVLTACATIFFVLIQYRVYQNYGKGQWTNSSSSTYCIFPIFSSAFGLMIATYVAILFVVIFSIIFVFGFCAPKQEEPRTIR